MNLLSFRDFLKHLNCLPPDLNELPGGIEHSTFLWSILSLKNLPSEMESFTLEEIAIQH